MGYDLGAAAARRWLERLPQAIAAHASRWDLELGPLLPGGRLSACIGGRDRDGRAVVLKLPASARDGRLELAALRAWSDGPVPRVYRSDGRTGAFVMERILPGTPVDASAGAASGLLGALHSAGAGAAGHGPFPPLRTALEERLRRAGQRCALPGNEAGRALHARAAARLERPLATAERVLLHGDLQAKNLLQGEAGVRAIDPLPCIGDPAFDAATWCVLGPAAEPIADRVRAIAAALHRHPAPIAEWAGLLCALEYRPYRPEQAERMLAYAGG